MGFQHAKLQCSCETCVIEYYSSWSTITMGCGMLDCSPELQTPFKLAIPLNFSLKKCIESFVGVDGLSGQKDTANLVTVMKWS